MNKTAIEWCDYTWNPVTGCLHGCPYCYARKIAERFSGSKAWPQGFEPMLRPERLTEPVNAKISSSIFVCSMADLFGEWVPIEWIIQIFQAECRRGYTFIHLTKNPANMMRLFSQFCGRIPTETESFLGMPYHWFGATVTGMEDIHRLGHLQQFPHPNRFISFEPLLGDPGPLDLTGIKQVIIGAQTNPDQYVGLEWVMKICEAADKAGAKVFMKDSLAGRWPDRELRRELAWPLNKSKTGGR